MSKPSKMHIEANFDVAQTSSTLECKFKRTDPFGNQKVGKTAGSVCFEQGDEVYIQVNAGGEMLLGGGNPFASFQVIECTLITRPRVYRCGPKEKKVEFAPPSFFVGAVGATMVLPGADFEKAPVDDTPLNYFRLGRAYKGYLTVGQEKARWRLTLLVTVAISYDDNLAPEMRVYEIDPEAEVGNGAGGDPPLEETELLAMATCEVDPEAEVGNGAGGSRV
jgi:hypothetical protein